MAPGPVQAWAALLAERRPKLLPNRAWAAAAAILLATLAAVLSSGPLSAQGPGGEPKVSPWVAGQVAEGGSAAFLVVLDRQADLAQAAAAAGKTGKGRAVRDALLSTARETQGPLLLWLRENGLAHRPFYIVNAVLVTGDSRAVAALAARSDVARIEANPRIQAVGAAGNELRQFDSTLRSGSVSPAAIEPNIAYVRAPEAWARGATGQGIVVAGQDTGYDWTHPALRPQYRGWDGASASHDYNWHDAIHANQHGANACGANAQAPCDDMGHGTHTMGTAVGSDGGANAIGVAPGARWIGCRNMDNGYGTPASYLECFEFFLAPYPVNGSPEDGDPDLAPDVTNNSWSCPPSEGCAPGTLEAAVLALRAAGILTVVSANNYGPDCSTVREPPATYASAVTVGALIKGSDEAAGFSSRGPVTVDGSGRPKPDLMAPGTTIRSSVPGGGYSSSWNGTSMAGPHVAGAAAVLWSAAPWLRADITRTTAILLNSAVPIASDACGSSGVPNNTYGYGRLDVMAAVAAARPLRWFVPLVVKGQ